MLVGAIGLSQYYASPVQCRGFRKSGGGGGGGGGKFGQFSKFQGGLRNVQDPGGLANFQDPGGIAYVGQ